MPGTALEYQTMYLPFCTNLCYCTIQSSVQKKYKNSNIIHQSHHSAHDEPADHILVAEIAILFVHHFTLLKPLLNVRFLEITKVCTYFEGVAVGMVMRIISIVLFVCCVAHSGYHSPCITYINMLLCILPGTSVRPRSFGGTFILNDTSLGILLFGRHHYIFKAISPHPFRHTIVTCSLRAEPALMKLEKRDPLPLLLLLLVTSLIWMVCIFAIRLLKYTKTFCEKLDKELKRVDHYIKLPASHHYQHSVHIGGLMQVETC